MHLLDRRMEQNGLSDGLTSASHAPCKMMQLSAPKKCWLGLAVVFQVMTP